METPSDLSFSQPFPPPRPLREAHLYFRNPGENSSKERCPGLILKPKGDGGEFCYITVKKFHKNRIPLSKHTHTGLCKHTHVHTHKANNQQEKFPFLSQRLIFHKPQQKTAPLHGERGRPSPLEGKENRAGDLCGGTWAVVRLLCSWSPSDCQTCLLGGLRPWQPLTHTMC